MPKRKFTPILGDLNRLTKEQQEEYVLAACEFLQVPPELGVVILSYMDVGDGARQLLLYIKKGGTDIIRDRRQISTTALTMFNTEGTVGWIATGVEATTGRQEIAVGAKSTKNLSGEKIADAIKTAQTQACRRMTLQFVGGGFMAEEEVDGRVTTNLASTVQLLSQIAQQPTTAINTGAGKDITPVKESIDKKEVSVNESVDNCCEHGVRKADHCYCYQCEKTDASKAQVVPSPETSQPETPIALSTAPSAVEEQPKRKRRRKTVSLDSPTSVAQTDPASAVSGSGVEAGGASAVAPAIDVKIPAPITTTVSITPAQKEALEALRASLPKLAKDPEPDHLPEAPEVKRIPHDEIQITKEQENQFRDKLSNYVNDILPRAGFLQSENLSRSAKMGAFVKKKFPNANTRKLTVNEWTALFNYMDEVCMWGAGVTALIQEIEAAAQGGI